MNNETEFVLSNVNERSLCGRLAFWFNEAVIREGINGYYVDVEYNRNLGKRVKTILDGQERSININCDLIIHSRGEIVSQDNLIAFEMKKSTRPLERKDSDRQRLRALTKDSFNDTWSFDGVTLPEHVCRYVIGIYMELDINNRICVLEYYRKGEAGPKEVKRF